MIYEYDNIRVIEDSNDEQSDSEIRKSKKKLRQINKWRSNVSRNSKALGLSHISLRGKHVKARVLLVNVIENVLLQLLIRKEISL